MLKKLVMFMILITSLYFIVFTQDVLVEKTLDTASAEMDKTIYDLSQKESVVNEISNQSMSNSKQKKVIRKQLQPEITHALTEMLSTSSEDLVEKKSDTGVSVNLKGRFQTVPVAIINENGDVEIQDYSSVPK